MSFLKLVENYPKQPEMTQFEKVLVAAKRAKDLHNGGKVPLIDTEHKAPYVALEELRDGAILLIYREEEPAPAVVAAPEEDEEE